MMKKLQVATKKSDDLYLFNYEDDAPRGHPIVDGCRGTIWRLTGASGPAAVGVSDGVLGLWTCVRAAMDRFFNVDEPVEGIDTSVIPDVPMGLQEKLDGTLVFLYWNEDKKAWVVGTRNLFDCAEQVVRNSMNLRKSFDLSLTASTDASKDASTITTDASTAATTAAPTSYGATNGLSKLDDSCKKYTFMFELCSPYNQVVVFHPQTQLTLLAVRENVYPFHEDDPQNFLKFFPDSLKLPQTFDFPDVVACRDFIEKQFKDTLGFEGMVLNQGTFQNPRRLKLKSKAFVLLAHSPGGNLKAIPEVQILNALLKGENELTELLTYYPVWTEKADRIKKLLTAFRQSIADSEKILAPLLSTSTDASTGTTNASKAQIAAIAKKSVCPHFFFTMTAKKTKNLEDYLANSDAMTVLQMIGYLKK